MKRAGSSKIQGKEVVEEEWPAPGGDTEEGEGSGEVVVAGRKIMRARVPRSARRERAARAAREAAALLASEVGSTDNNQGLPGSVEGGQSMKETEAGQSQQDEEDAIWQDARIVALIARHNQSDDEHRAARKELEAELTDAHNANAWREREVNKHKRTIREQDNAATALTTRLEAAEKDAKDAKDAAAADKFRYGVSENLMTRMRDDIVAVNDALKVATKEKHELEELHDDTFLYSKKLEGDIDQLEYELKSMKAVATENTTLKEEIAEVHSSFEDVFSDMAKGLTINEKFAYVREHQTTAPAPAPAGRPRIVSTSSLHEELDDDHSVDHSDDHSDDHFDAGSEHKKAATKEPLSFSPISSVESVPVAVPVAAPVPAVKPFAFSGISVAETVPVLPATKSATPLGFSGITTAENVPVLPAVKSTTPLSISGITSVETTPIAPEMAPIKKPAPVVRIQWRNRLLTEHVDRPYVPWWMMLLFLIGMIACACGFAGLLRENQIWLDANDLAYQRLMGAEQETLLASVSMGVQDLLPGMGGMGHSLFG